MSRKIFFVLIVLLVIPFLFVPVIPVTVTYYDEEPYQRLFAYQVISSEVRWGLDLVRGIYHTMEVKLQNADTRPGTFRVILELFDEHGSLGRREVAYTLSPGEVKVFSAEWNTKLGQKVWGKYEVIPPIVQTSRSLMKYKLEYRSLVDLMFMGSRRSTFREIAFDDDKDGIPNDVEFSLRDLGADPKRRDIFVEVDWMEGTSLDVTKIVYMFVNAPINNIDGTRGVAIHIIFDDKIPAVHVYADEFYRIRSKYRDHEWFYYCVLAQTVGKGYFGDEAGFSLGAEGFAVEARAGILGAFGRGLMPIDFIFIHELGHTIGLMPSVFDGIDSYKYSPDEYRSAMNYNQPLLSAIYDYSRGGVFNDWEYLEEHGFTPPV